MGFYRHRMPDREIQMAKEMATEKAREMAKDWTEQNLDAQIQTEISPAEYWQTQAAMWHNKYIEAHRYELDHETFMLALEQLATGRATAERARQIALKALENRKVQ